MSARFCFFFFNDPATTEIYTLSLHDALPISPKSPASGGRRKHRATSGARNGHQSPDPPNRSAAGRHSGRSDRKSTRLNSSHGYISYAVFCLKKKKTNKKHIMYIVG